MKFRFAALRINSIDMKMTMMLRRVKHARHTDDEQQRADHQKLRQVGIRRRVLHLRKPTARSAS